MFTQDFVSGAGGLAECLLLWPVAGRGRGGVVVEYGPFSCYSTEEKDKISPLPSPAPNKLSIIPQGVLVP